MKRGTLALVLLALAARAERPDRDDPRGRMEARRLIEGDRTPEQQLEILRAAEAEAVKYGLRPGIDRPAAVAGSAWVNIGPTTADSEYNAATYHKVDSGRARKIIVDPRDANVVYFATSGGGVWKSYDALAPISATSGPHWQAITESVGSLSIGALAMNPAAPDSLLLGLGDPFDVQAPGLLHSDDGGATWSIAVALSGSYVSGGPVYTATSVREIAFDPGGAIVFAATNAGLFRSTEGGIGTSWNLVNLASTNSPQNCWSLAYAGPHIWLASCVDAGSTQLGSIFRSTDDGLTFAPVTLPTADVTRMTLASASRPSAPSGWRLYVLAADGKNADQKDVFRSDDAGATWSSLNMGPSFATAPINPTDHQGNLDFTHDQAFYNQMIVVDPANPDVLFVGGNLSMGRSTDGGTTWRVMTDWLPFTLGTLNGGLDTTFDSPQYVHSDWHAAAIAHFGSNTYFYGGTDGGIFRAVDNGTSGVLTSPPGSVAWEDKLNRGIVSHLVFSVATGTERGAAVTACNPATDANLVYGGLQDNGTRLRVLSGGTNYLGFNQVAGGDGFGVGVGCVSAGGIGSNLISTYVSQIRSSDNGGATFTARVKADGTGLTPPITLDPSYTFHMRIATDLGADRTYLTSLTDTALCGWVYRSTDGGHSWSSITGAITRISTTGCAGTASFPFPLKNIAADPINSGHYATVGISRAYVTIDGGTTWSETTRVAQNLLSGSDYMSPFTVAFDPVDTTGNTIWVGSKSASTAIAGASVSAAVGHLFKSTNALAGSSVVWTAVHTGLPNVPINVVKLDPGDHNTVYVGTEIGLYRSTDGGGSFTRYGSGLPLVSVTDLAISADGSSLRIATYGRGFWEIHPNPNAPAGVAGNGDFDGNQVIDGFDLVREAAVLFTDSSFSDYNWIGNLVGVTNQIDQADMSVLLGKMGGRP